MDAGRTVHRKKNRQKNEETGGRWGRILGAGLVWAGLLLGTLFNAGAVWADFEGNMFSNSLPAEERINSLRCPIFITPGAQSAVSVTFENPTDGTLRRAVRSTISDGFVSLVREDRQTIFIEPGQRQTVSWPISAQDAAWDRFVLVRVYGLRAAPLPSVTGSCGVWRLPFAGVSGDWLLMLSLGTIGLLLGGGWWLSVSGRGSRTESEKSSRNLLLAITVLVLAGIGANLLALWLLGLGLVVLSLLLLIVAFSWIAGGVGE